MTIAEGLDVSKKYLLDLLPEVDGTAVKLEEVDVTPSANRWSFTFSTIQKVPTETSFGTIVRNQRIAKAVIIDTQTGALIALKNSAE